jgi:hypothetical protein
MTHEPAHIFRVRLGCGDEEYVSADTLMVAAQTGIIQLRNDDSLQPVAVFIPLPGLSVVRVDTLVGHDNLTEREA